MPPPIDLSSADFQADPYPAYRRLRETEPVRWLPFAGPTGGMWLITRYHDVAAVLRDPRLSKDLGRVVPAERLSLLDRTMAGKDPPDHTRLRSLASQAFTPRRVEELEPRVARAAERLLAPLLDRGSADFIADFAAPLPVLVIAELLGIPAEDEARFRRWSGDFIGSVDATRAGARSRRAQRAALEAMSAYFRELIRERRERRRDDLVSALIDARDRDERLSEEELVGTCVLLLITGHETTTHLLGNGLLSLLRHPDQLALLRERPALLPSAVEEVLRFESPVQRTTIRIAAEELEVGGRRIPAGQQVSAVLGAANRDPEQFADPDRFDVTRDPNRHLAFGVGPHYCLGASLARLEARVALRVLLGRSPGIRLLGEPEWSPSSAFRALRSLPIGL